MSKRIAFRCDVGPSIGVGHLMRSLALAEELAARGIEPLFAADVESVPWAAEQLARRGFAVHAPPDGPQAHVDWFVGHAADAVVYDSYLLPRQVYRAVRTVGLTTMAIIDGPRRGAEADLYLDQTMGSERDSIPLPDGSTRLAGLSYALLRDEVRARRPGSSPVARAVSEPHVLAVFGGTDAHGAGPAAVRALAATGRPFRMTLIAARDELATQAAAVPLNPGQSLYVSGPTDRLAEVARSADLVVSAAGSSTWELLSLGSCAALVVVADNQEVGYRRLVDAGLAAGLGTLRELALLRRDTVVALTSLLSDHRERTALSRAAWRSVDGHGRERAADALVARLTAPSEDATVR
jgi:spore coat polysaccharide biosynthesis predicted glycosyltransferase SpsG